MIYKLIYLIEEGMQRKYIKDQIEPLVKDGLYTKYKDRIIFATSVHSVECWILPLTNLSSDRQESINNCLHKVQDYLDKDKNLQKIRLKNKKPRDYEKITKDYRKHKILINAYKKIPAFVFLLKNLTVYSSF